jgi:hypothetical protein
MSKIRLHLLNALNYLSIDAELDRLTAPRHSDKEVLLYLPRRVAKDVVNARREIEAAIDELSRSAD